jgi:hypothetical protein
LSSSRSASGSTWFVRIAPACAVTSGRRAARLTAADALAASLAAVAAARRWLVSMPRRTA